MATSLFTQGVLVDIPPDLVLINPKMLSVKSDGITALEVNINQFTSTQTNFAFVGKTVIIQDQDNITLTSANGNPIDCQFKLNHTVISMQAPTLDLTKCQTINMSSPGVPITVDFTNSTVIGLTVPTPTNTEYTVTNIPLPTTIANGAFVDVITAAGGVFSVNCGAVFIVDGNTTEAGALPTSATFNVAKQIGVAAIVNKVVSIAGSHGETFMMRWGTNNKLQIGLTQSTSTITAGTNYSASITVVHKSTTTWPTA